MQGEGLLKGDFLRFFLGKTTVDEVLVRLSADMVFSLVQWWLVFSP